MQQDMEIPQKIKSLYDDLFMKFGSIDTDAFRYFFDTIQKEKTVPLSDSDITFILQRFRGSKTQKFSSTGLSLEEFMLFLVECEHNIPIETKVTHDMNLPLSHYFIHTSHNTYLKGNQLMSECSVKPIIKALHRGVRVVELDLWPSDSKSKVLVKHGGTLTKSVRFEECLVAIKENAFLFSDYPVIVTLEDHLPAFLQVQAAESLIGIFGSFLYIPDDFDFISLPSPSSLKHKILISTKYPKANPEPDGQIRENAAIVEKLKILKEKKASKEIRKKIKEEKQYTVRNASKKFFGSFQKIYSSGKSGSYGFTVMHRSEKEKTVQIQEDKNIVRNETASQLHCNSIQSEESLPDANVEISKSDLVEKNSDASEAINASEIDFQFEIESTEIVPNSDMAYVARDDFTENLSNARNVIGLNEDPLYLYRKIVTIIGGKVSTGEAKRSLMDDGSVKRVSLSEGLMESLVETSPKELVTFSRRNILRIYPKGTRVDSSNVDPILAWSHGAQWVAINMQGYGRPLWLSHGFFLANGGCGYVKKPNFFLQDENIGNAEISKPITFGDTFNPSVPQPYCLILNMDILFSSGWKSTFDSEDFDTLSAPDFYMKVEMEGVQADKCNECTDVAFDTWNPIWKKKSFSFKLSVPELALLIIEVWENNIVGSECFVGQTVFPISILKEGFRSIILKDKKGNHIETLRFLCFFELKSL